MCRSSASAAAATLTQHCVQYCVQAVDASIKRSLPARSRVLHSELLGAHVQPLLNENRFERHAALYCSLVVAMHCSVLVCAARSVLTVHASRELSDARLSRVQPVASHPMNVMNYS